MPINTAMTLKDIALCHAAAARVLESFHLDYCCEGEQTLEEACREAKIDAQEVLAKLAQADAELRLEPCRQESTLSEQAGFILGRHHVFARAKLPRVGTLLTKVIERHGVAHLELKAVGDCFTELQVILDSHMVREEQVLFPNIKALDKHHCGQAPLPPGCLGAIEDLMRQSEDDHRALGNLLKKIRELTSDFASPADASSTYRNAYQALAELETTLLQHIHLENNALFPRVQQVVGKV